jgi:hypothetical protein
MNLLASYTTPRADIIPVFQRREFRLMEINWLAA